MLDSQRRRLLSERHAGRQFEAPLSHCRADKPQSALANARALQKAN
jgi:hypothetical protein